MKLYGGIDGGQSSTRALIADSTGKILGRGRAGGADEVGQPAHSTRVHDAFTAALQGALASANLPVDSRLEAVVAGLSGYDGMLRSAPPQLNTGKFELMHDARVAHAAVFSGGAGVLVIAGTGSVAYGANPQGEASRIGGWGYLFGDEGSGFWIGRRLLERAMRDDDQGMVSTIKANILEYYGYPSLIEIAQAFYGGAIERATIAAFAPRAFALARSGVEDARLVVEQAADAIAALAALCARSLHSHKRVIGQAVPIGFCGGLLQDATFAAHVHAKLADRLPEAFIVGSAHEPAIGALTLAYRAAGVDPLPDVRA